MQEIEAWSYDVANQSPDNDQKSREYNNSDKTGEEFNYTEYINNQFNSFDITVTAGVV